MKTVFDYERCDGELCSISCKQMSDDGTTVMSHAGANFVKTRYCGGWLPTMLIGGVGTDPRFRRQGCVRETLNTLHRNAPEYGAAVSLLHPFSFDYYRKFGYERVSDTIIVNFPITALSFLERYPDLVPLTEDRIPDVLSVFEGFSAKRELMIRRTDGGRFPLEKTWLYYREDGTPAGYIVLEGQAHFDVNRAKSDNLHVYELGFLDRDALVHLLSFLRMFDGEFDTVRIHDMGPVPEVDFVLRNYMHTHYDIRPDIMARVLDTEAMLRAVRYPDTHGVFTLRMDDTLDTVRGTFRVEYENGACEITRTDDASSTPDLALSPQAFVRFFYGVDAFTRENAAYLDGVSLYTDAQDFFRAFPKRIRGVYEHF